MLQATYTSAMGINSQQKRLDTIGNNLSNSNTNGFKAERTNFKTALYSTMLRPTQPQDDVDLELGHGTLVSGYYLSFLQGQNVETGVDTDCEILGQGFFVVNNANQETLYTRDGHFEKSLEQDGMYLTVADGSYVMDVNNQRIKIPTDQEGNFTIMDDGSLRIGSNEPFAKLAVVNFANLQGLENVSTNMFRRSETTGDPVQMADNTYQVRGGALEGSNVNLSLEFTRMIRTQRAMQLCSRSLSTSDQMDETAINIRQG